MFTKVMSIVSSLASATGWAHPVAGEIDATLQGINIKIGWVVVDSKPCWAVALPDWENLPVYYRPGMSIPTKWVALEEYLQILEKEFRLR